LITLDELRTEVRDAMNLDDSFVLAIQPPPAVGRVVDLRILAESFSSTAIRRLQVDNPEHSARRRGSSSGR
jgi:hypothetical protein